MDDRPSGLATLTAARARRVATIASLVHARGTERGATMESTLTALPSSPGPPASEMGEICNVLNRLSLRSSSAPREEEPTTGKIISQRILTERARAKLEINEIRFRPSGASLLLRCPHQFVPFSGRHPPPSKRWMDREIRHRLFRSRNHNDRP